MALEERMKVRSMKTTRHHLRKHTPVVSRHVFEGQIVLAGNRGLSSVKENFFKLMRSKTLEEINYIPTDRNLPAGERKLLNCKEVPGELGLLIRTYAKFLFLKLPFKAPFATVSVILEQSRACNFIVSMLALLEESHGPFQLHHLWYFVSLQQNENLSKLVTYTRKRSQRAMDRAIDFGDFLLYCLPNETNLIPIFLELENKFSAEEKSLIIRLGDTITESMALLIRVCLTNWVLYFDNSIQASFIFYYQVEDFDPDEEFVFAGPEPDPVFEDVTNSLTKFLYSPISGIIEDESGIIRNLVFIYIKNIIHSLKPKPRRKVPFHVKYFNNLPNFFDLDSDFISKTWTNIQFLYFSLSKFLDFLAYSKISSNLHLDFRSLCKRIEKQLANQDFSYEKINFISDFYKWPK